MKNFEQLSKAAYQAYCKQAGGLTFDGQVLPSYHELGADRQACWIAAAKAVAEEVKHIH